MTAMRHLPPVLLAVLLATGAGCGDDDGGGDAGPGTDAGPSVDTGTGDTDAGGDGLYDCDPSHTTCRAIPPMCPSGQVPSVEGECWGMCVPFVDCRPIECDPTAMFPRCPDGTACDADSARCIPE